MKHRIASIAWATSDRGASVACLCGYRIETETDDQLARAYTDHVGGWRRAGTDKSPAVLGRDPLGAQDRAVRKNKCTIAVCRTTSTKTAHFGAPQRKSGAR